MDRPALEKFLGEQIYRLGRGDAVRRWNLIEWIDPRAHRYFGIDPNATYADNLSSISARFTSLIDRLPDEHLKAVARYHLGLTGKDEVDTMKLGRRQEALAAAGGPARTACYELMNKPIVPLLVRAMIEDEPRSR